MSLMAFSRWLRSSDSELRQSSTSSSLDNLKNNTDVVNKGDKLTFMIAIGKEVLDLTLTSPAKNNKIINWHVSDKVSMSDHKHIRFYLEAELSCAEVYRIPSQTDYVYLNSTMITEVKGNMDSSGDLDLAAS